MVEGGGFAMQAQVKRAQKRLSVLLRTLYAFLRLAPTHGVVKKLEEVSSCAEGIGGGRGLGKAEISPSLYAGLLNTLRGDVDALLSSGEEGGGEEGRVFEAYRFADVVTPYGVFRVCVAYRKNASDFERAAEAAAATAAAAAVQQQGSVLMMQPTRIISDYVVGKEGGREARHAIPTQRQEVPPPPPESESGLTHALRDYAAEKRAAAAAAAATVDLAGGRGGEGSSHLHHHHHQKHSLYHSPTVQRQQQQEQQQQQQQ
eukprot:evm.model.NODE_18614_length_4542_cov_26.601057.2